MNAEIIAVGTELLLGHVVNTNTSFLARKLAGLGINLFHQTTVGDNPKRLKDTIIKALSRADIVITTGGLGPTVDDITSQIISEAIGREMIFNRGIFRRIERYYMIKGIKNIPQYARKMAYIPKGAKLIKNDVGTAPGLVIPVNRKFIIALPGPPGELEPMVERKLIKILRSRKGVGTWIIKTKALRIIGMPESKVNDLVRHYLEKSGKTTLGIYTGLGIVDLKITTRAKNKRTANINIKKIERQINNIFGNDVFGVDYDKLEHIVSKLLIKKGLTVSVAESCTGGLITHRLTNISGSSKYMKAGVIAYANRTKEDLLGVPAEALKKYGAVSPEVARIMSEKIRRITKTDISLAVTGIAGPTGGTRRKPVGLVFISRNYKGKIVTKKYIFTGSREDIKFHSSQKALDLLRRTLL